VSYRVVITSRSPTNLAACVRSIMEHEPGLPSDHIIVVDDGARGRAEAELPGLTWVAGIRPFVFSRNVNLGITEAGGADVILLNDDATLVTPNGFTRLAETARDRPELGICSAAIRGAVGNPRQRPLGTTEVRRETRTLAFVCVFLPRSTRQRLGPLDERFVGYGFEDNDYCARAMACGLQLGIWDGCVVDHTGALPSSFRSSPGVLALLRQNRRIFHAKWAGGPSRRVEHATATATVDGERPGQVGHATATATVDHERPVDLLYLARNRLEFTRETFECLLANTDWRLVRELFVYDDGSVDGTREWLQQQHAQAPTRTSFVRTQFHSPVAAMGHFIEAAQAPLLAKTDNDAMLPPGWLRESLDVMARHPELSLLGIEAMYPVDEGSPGARTYEPAAFVSGLGVYRRAAFTRSLPVAYRKWFGLEEWQQRQGPGLVRGWIRPALPVFLLDRVPFPPWSSHSAAYIRRGWQREWPNYDPACTLWEWRWPRPAPAEAARHQPGPGSAPQVLCALRVRNEAEHIGEVLSRALDLCDRAFVFDDHSTDPTVEICRAFSDRVEVLGSPFEGLDEARDKNYLLGKIVEAAPTWVLWIDGDEVLERTGPDALRDAAAHHPGAAAFSLRIAYVWDTPDQVRVDGIFGRFRRPSLFRLAGQPVHRLRFPSAGPGPNLHCGNVPQGLVGRRLESNVRLKHYGYVTEEQRWEKYQWYNSIDPHNRIEDRYRHLISAPGAFHAPGPVRLIRWSE
jgi:GT2 family glycosyltransferase/glycosyltransferase involved in cell wall biosynthesis